ncbi:hypothetical protein RB195_007501 [Necator americanus]|uniref:Uncharacterized protein n=1 Tax=Necator americanus TaxID=51031 RepID=A0ABR1C0V2_NECAM
MEEQQNAVAHISPPPPTPPPHPLPLRIYLSFVLVLLLLLLLIGVCQQLLPGDTIEFILSHNAHTKIQTQQIFCDDK